MKRRTLLLLLVLVIISTAVMITSCTQWTKPYETLDGEGATVSVKFLAGEGATFAGTNGVTVVDVFNVANYTPDGEGNVKITLFDPSNEDVRGHDAFEVAKTGHALAGWFVATPVKNAAGEILDADGNVASVSGKEPAYEIGRRWNFETDKLTVDKDGSYTSSEPALTLTAVWIPYTTFEFYDVVDGTPVKYGSYQGLSLDLPVWDIDSTGKLNYGKFVQLEGKTLVSAYLDEAMTEPMTGRIDAEFDLENGVSLTPVIKIYTAWRDGEWVKVSTPAQLVSNASSKGCYEILADLDFSNTSWPAAFVNNEFKGQIVGNGHTISGIKTTANISKGGNVSHGALFGALSQDAVISDLTFDNVTYTLKSAAKATYAFFGLFAGTNNGATLTNVSLTSSKIIVTANFSSDFKGKLMSWVKVDEETGEETVVSPAWYVGLVFASGDLAGLDISGVALELETGTTATVTPDENGLLTFVYPK